MKTQVWWRDTVELILYFVQFHLFLFLYNVNVFDSTATSEKHLISVSEYKHTNCKDLFCQFELFNKVLTLFIKLIPVFFFSLWIETFDVDASFHDHNFNLFYYYL